MSINNSSECLPRLLPPGDFDQEIDVLRENDLAQGHRPIKHIGIIYRIRAVLLSGQDGDAAEAQPSCHRAAHVCVHVQR